MEFFWKWVKERKKEGDGNDGLTKPSPYMIFQLLLWHHGFGLTVNLVSIETAEG
jgi:hypothetical protein